MFVFDRDAGLIGCRFLQERGEVGPVVKVDHYLLNGTDDIP